MARSGINDVGLPCSKCHSKKRVAVWLIYKKNGVGIDQKSQEILCHPCFNAWTEFHYVDEYHIARLSEDEHLYEVNDNGRRTPNSAATHAAHQG